MPPCPHAPAAPTALGRLAGGRPQGAAVPCDPPDSGGRKCQLLPPPSLEPLDRICLGARHLQLAGRGASARLVGAGTRRGWDSEATSHHGQTHAGLPRSSSSCQPMARRCRFLCKSAEASAFIEKSTEPIPPSLHHSLSPSFPLHQIPCPISLQCEQELVLDKWEDGRGLCNQALSLIMHLRD